MTIEMMSFGYQNGRPEADTILDMRCLENPYWVPELRELCGLDQPVRDYIFHDTHSVQYAERLLELLRLQARLTEQRAERHQSGCDRLRIAVGCTGGRHRSVAMAEFLAEALRNDGYTVRLIHRDL